MPAHGASTSTLRVKFIDRLGDLSEEWDALVDRQPLPSPFLKSWWLDNAAQGTPTILCFLNGDELVGGAAFEADRVKLGPIEVERIRSLGQGVLCPDHLDVISTPAHREQVCNEVLAWLNRPGTRVVDLDGLSARGSLGAALLTRRIDRIAAPYASLAGGLDEYLAARPGKLRSTAKRSAKRFAARGVGLSVVDAGDEIALQRALDSLAELHDNRWADRSRFLGAFERFRAAAVQGARSGAVLIYELRGDEDGVVSVEVDLVAGERVCFYQAGRRTDHEWRGCGTVLRTGIIKELGEAGKSEYDLLRGDESYKTEWATDARELVRVRFGVGAFGWLVATVANAWKKWGPALVRAKSSALEAASRTFSRAPWRRRRGVRSEQSG